MKKGINRKKKEVKPVKRNVSKNLQSFLEVGAMRKEVLPTHKLPDHAYEY